MLHSEAREERPLRLPRTAGRLCTDGDRAARAAATCGGLRSVLAANTSIAGADG